ncbi:nitrous oxide reductase accessory protein NosL [Sulfurimonas sp.]
MKFFKILLLGLLISASLFGISMTMFQSVSPEKATLLQAGKAKKFCPICGMTLNMFYKTNHAAQHNGNEKQYCSIHCLVEDKELNHVDLKDIKVVDVSSLKFIDAQNAYYVVGSDKKATMSMISKYAFKNKEDALAFSKKFGGDIMNFNKAYMEARKDFADDARMISKKQKKSFQMGMMMYNKLCKKSSKTFSTIAEAKAYVNAKKLCGTLKPKQLQAIGLYLYKR